MRPYHGHLEIVTDRDCRAAPSSVSVIGTGIVRVAGLDEAGMSPLAGPVSAACVVFAPGSRIPGIDDSKKLDAAARDQLARNIKETAVAWSVGFADVEEIDALNIYWASRRRPAPAAA